MTEHEIKLINKSIESYKNMIKYFKKQIHILERKKLVVHDDCSECIRLPISKGVVNEPSPTPCIGEEDEETESV